MMHDQDVEASERRHKSAIHAIKPAYRRADVVDFSPASRLCSANGTVRRSIQSHYSDFTSSIYGRMPSENDHSAEESQGDQSTTLIALF